jgi:signal transduction histidine kinase
MTATEPDWTPGGAGHVVMDRVNRGLLDAVVAVASGLDLEAALERIVQTAAELVGARYGALGVLGPDRTSLREFVHVGMSPEDAATVGHLPRGRGVLGLLLVDDPQAMLVDDISAHPESFGFPPGHPPMHSFLGVPIRVRGAVFGNLYLTEKQGAEAFTDEDLEVVEALAVAAGVAIENARLYETVRLRASWLRASTEITGAVLSGEPLEAVLELITSRAQEVSGSDLVLLGRPDGEGQLVYLQAAGEGSEALRGLSVPEGYLAAEVQRTGRSVVVEQLDDGHSVTPPVRLSSAATMMMPLKAGGQTSGVLVFGNRHGGRRFTDDELVTAQAFADQAALALVMADAQREKERLVVLEDRDRIARDLHDLVIQRLFATGMALQAVTRRPGIPPEAADRIGRAVDELDETIVEVRQTIFALQESGRSEPSGLRGRILRESASAMAVLGFEPTVQFSGPIDSVVPEPVADHLLAALREALSNAGRHANCSWVRIGVSVDDADVVLTVSDNGRGIGATTRRSGLANMASRAAELGGYSKVESVRDDGTGTRLTWRAPVR